jgi:hypothetical protein
MTAKNKILPTYLFMTCLLFLSCGGETSTPTAPSTPAAKVPTSITLSPTALAGASVGATGQLTATVKDQSAVAMAGQTVTWTTSDATVATVSSTGLVTAVTDGTATITATSGSLTATATVTVGVVAALIELAPTTKTFASPGDTGTVVATVKDAGGTIMSGQTVTWTSSDTLIASVNDAVITAHRPGTVTVTATVGSASKTLEVTNVDETLPTAAWTRTSTSYNDEVYGDVDIKLTASDAWGIDSVGIFIDGTEVGAISCKNTLAYTPTEYVTSSTTVSCDRTASSFVFVWHSNLLFGGTVPFQAKVYDQGGNLKVLNGTIANMHQPYLTYNNLLARPVVIKSKTNGAVLLSTDTVPAQDSIKGWARIPSNDSIRVSWNMIRSARSDNALFGADLSAAFYSSTNAAEDANVATATYKIDNVIGSTTYIMPLWKNNSGIRLQPDINSKTFSSSGSRQQPCWNGSRYLCEFPSDGVNYTTGYYLFDQSYNEYRLHKETSNTTRSGGSWRWYNTSTLNMATGSGTRIFECAAPVAGGGDCASYLTTTAGASSEEASDGIQSNAEAGDATTSNVPSQLPSVIDIVFGGPGGETFQLTTDTDAIRIRGAESDDVADESGSSTSMNPVLDGRPRVESPIILIPG